MIDQLSAYMKSTGKTYQDHFATILLWAGREERKPVLEDMTLRKERAYDR